MGIAKSRIQFMQSPMSVVSSLYVFVVPSHSYIPIQIYYFIPNWILNVSKEYIFLKMKNLLINHLSSGYQSKVCFIKEIPYMEGILLVQLLKLRIAKVLLIIRPSFRFFKRYVAPIQIIFKIFYVPLAFMVFHVWM